MPFIEFFFECETQQETKQASLDYSSFWNVNSSIHRKDLEIICFELFSLTAARQCLISTPYYYLIV